MARLSKRTIEAAIRQSGKDGKDGRLWHDSPKGLGVRIKPSGSASFFVQYTSPETGRKVRHSFGQFGQLSVDEAVKEARRLFAQIVGNEDPAREKRRAMAEARLKARTMRELCKQYMEDAEAGLVTYRGRPKKQSTLKIDRGRVDRHILPLLGDKLVQDIGLRDVERFFHAVRRGDTAVTERTGPRGVARVTGGATTAARTVDLLGSLFSYAMRQGLRDDNPVKGFERPPTAQRDRALSPPEFVRLGDALRALESEGRNPVAISAFRVLALTGCRRSEVFNLEVDWVDSHRQVLRFPDTKAGRQLRPIGRAALDEIEQAMERFGRGDAASKEGRSCFVFPGARADTPLVGPKLFKQAVEAAELKDVSLHTLRHSFASVALELGYSELTIGGLIGHTQHSVTSRYAHHVDRALVSAADRVSGRISELLGCFAPNPATDNQRTETP